MSSRGQRAEQSRAGKRRPPLYVRSGDCTPESQLPASYQPRGQSSTTDPIVEPVAALRLGHRVRGKLFDGREVDRRDARCCRLGE
jgi:hypothetical protein